MASGYDFYLNAAVNAAADPVVQAGGSGYFSRPQKGLDPRLFEGDHLRPDVRQWVLKTLYGFWKFKDARAWSTVWAAGSGISYQWAADRGNGDLDILIGVDFPKFFEHNPDYQGIPENDMADIFNEDFHLNLWPKTANWNGFEVTFYVNPNSSDIRNINPYAAYNITADQWTVKPPALPDDPRTLYPTEYFKAVGDERKQAEALVARYTSLKAQADGSAPGTPGWHNSLAALNVVATQAHTLYDSIHLGRKNAFGPGGSGYGDYYNFRWQSHKQAGTVKALADLAHVDAEAHTAQQTDLYGRAIASAQVALTQASLWSRRTS